MTTTENRLQELAQQHLDLDRNMDFDAGLGDAGVSSLDALAFVKKVADAFGVEVPPEEVSRWKTMRDFASYLDLKAG